MRMLARSICLSFNNTLCGKSCAVCVCVCVLERVWVREQVCESERANKRVRHWERASVRVRESEWARVSKSERVRVSKRASVREQVSDEACKRASGWERKLTLLVFEGQSSQYWWYKNEISSGIHRNIEHCGEFVPVWHVAYLNKQIFRLFSDQESVFPWTIFYFSLVLSHFWLFVPSLSFYLI